MKTARTRVVSEHGVRALNDNEKRHRGTHTHKSIIEALSPSLPAHRVGG